VGGLFYNLISILIVYLVTVMMPTLAGIVIFEPDHAGFNVMVNVLMDE